LLSRLISRAQSTILSLRCRQAFVALYGGGIVDHRFGNAPSSASAAFADADHARYSVNCERRAGHERGDALVPLRFISNGLQISAMVFSIDYDDLCLQFDLVDADGDGIQDNLMFDAPPDFFISASFDGGDANGEIDITIADASLPHAVFPDSTVLTIRLTMLCKPEVGAVIQSPVRFSQSPTPGFTASNGGAAPGTFINGSVLIVGTPPPAMPMPTVTPTPTHTPHATSTVQPPLTPLPTATDPGTISGTIPSPAPTHTPGDVFMPLVLATRPDAAETPVQTFLPLITAECGEVDLPSSCLAEPEPDQAPAGQISRYADVPKERIRLRPKSTAVKSRQRQRVHQKSSPPPKSPRLRLP